MKSKTIILSDPNSQTNARGILSFYEEDDLLKCKLRTYSMPKLPRETKLGIYHNKEVFSSNLIERNGQYESSLVGTFNIDADFYCALINTQNNQPIIAGGTYGGHFFNSPEVFTEQTEEPPKQPCQNCENCIYKQHFYSSKTEEPTLIQSQQEIKTEPQINQQSEEKLEEKIETKTISQSILPQFKYIFNTYPENPILNSKINGGKFVDITENGENYSLGAIYEENELKYIAYAIKCPNNATPPAEIGKHYQWLPLDILDPLSEGYFIVFQDANDLKILEF
jgi:hypothetical protein